MAITDKTLYDRKIIYLDYYERSQKVKNGGFIKWEIKGDQSRVQLQIRGLYPTDTLQGEIQLVSGGEKYPADKIMINYGAGEYVALWKNENLAQTGIAYEDCESIHIKISDTRLLMGKIREKAEVSDKVDTAVSLEDVTAKEDILIREDKNQEDINQENINQVDINQIDINQENNNQVEIKSEDINQVDTDKNISSEEIKQENRIDKKPENPKRKQPEPLRLHGNKWEQLATQYAKITPFGDGREFLSITPRDFIVLSEKYHNLVQNSFLLHGYYNYGHVVLTKESDITGDVYYLGVPGVYFEREKQAALLFGFEGFEAGSKELSDGGFGYYMKKVEL